MISLVLLFYFYHNSQYYYYYHFRYYYYFCYYYYYIESVNYCLVLGLDSYCGSILASPFKCESEDKIIPYKNKCDGFPSCSDGSDEKNCGIVFLCRI